MFWKGRGFKPRRRDNFLCTIYLGQRVDKICWKRQPGNVACALTLKMGGWILRNGWLIKISCMVVMNELRACQLNNTPQCSFMLGTISKRVLRKEKNYLTMWVKKDVTSFSVFLDHSLLSYAIDYIGNRKLNVENINVENINVEKLKAESQKTDCQKDKWQKMYIVK